MNAKTIRKWLILGGLLTAIGIAYADFNVQDKGSYYNNASTGSRTTSQGHQTVAEQDPAMDANLTFANAIGPISLAAGAADSSAILDTHRMRLGMLLIKCTPQSVTGADSLGTVRLAIQIRTHLQAADDSSSTFAIYMYAKNDMGVTAAASQLDTTYTGQIFNAVNLAASAQSPHSGEFGVAVAINRIGPGTSVVGSLGQRLFWYPNGIAIPLQNVYGRELYSPYTSIRIRNIGTAGPANRTVVISAHLVGSPL